METLITIGILGIMAIGTASLMGLVAQNTFQMRITTDVNSIQTELRIIGTTNSLCSAGLGAGIPFDATAAASDDGQPFRVNLLNGNNVAAGSSIPGTSLRFQSLSVSEAALVSTNRYVAKLNAVLELDPTQNPKSAIPSYPLREITTLALEVSGGNIVGCGQLPTEVNEIEVVQSNCNLLNGVFDTVNLTCTPGPPPSWAPVSAGSCAPAVCCSGTWRTENITCPSGYRQYRARRYECVSGDWVLRRNGSCVRI